MPVPSEIVHAGMAAQIRRTLRQRVTIQRAEVARDEAGQETRTWATIPGHHDLPCAVAITASGAGGVPRSGKRRTPEVVAETLNRAILIGRHLPTIIPTDRALVDGTAYEIIAVDLD